MRDLRRRAWLMNNNLASDYTPFYDEGRNSFFRLPSEPLSAKDPVGVTATATAFMALAQQAQLQQVISPTDDDQFRARIFGSLKALLAHTWGTAGLKENNAFTSVLIVRAVGLLLNAGYVERADVNRLSRTHPDEDTLPTGERKAIADKETSRRFQGKPIDGIANAILSEFPKSLGVQEYPATPALAYWLLDGVRSLGLAISDEQWAKIARTMSEMFLRQVSLIDAQHTSLMDPIQLAMAASACRQISEAQQCP